jgi:hypothetical protein
MAKWLAQELLSWPERIATECRCMLADIDDAE